MHDIRGFDVRRWRWAEDSPCVTAHEAVGTTVRRSSGGLPWKGLSVWEQVGPVGDLYLPPSAVHCIIVRRGAPTNLVQRHGRETRVSRWNTGEVLVVPAGTPTFWRTEAPRHNVHLDISPAWLAKAAGDADAPLLQSGFGRRDALMQGMAEALIAALDQPTAMQSTFGDAMASALAVHLVERYAAAGCHARPAAALTARQMRKVADYVQAHLHAPCDVGRLAREVELSPAHFSRAFKFTCGMTPHQFVLRQKLEHARARLSTSADPVGVVAAECGFASRAHFALAMRRHWGALPSELRRNG